MKRGNSSNCVHWLYAVRTGTATSIDSVICAMLVLLLNSAVPGMPRGSPLPRTGTDQTLGRTSLVRGSFVSNARVPGSLSTMTAQERAVEIGSASLTGVRGRVAKSVAKPIARRTGLTREQVEAIIGFLILAYGIYQVVRPLVRASRRST